MVYIMCVNDTPWVVDMRVYCRGGMARVPVAIRCIMCLGYGTLPYCFNHVCKVASVNLSAIWWRSLCEYVYIYIYIYIERERERERLTERGSNTNINVPRYCQLYYDDSVFTDLYTKIPNIYHLIEAYKRQGIPLSDIYQQITRVILLLAISW